MASLFLSVLTIVLVAVACQGNYQTWGRFARFGEDNRYYLYTREDPRNPVRVDPTVLSVNAIRVWKQNTVIVIHDIQGSFATGLNPTVKDALLTAEDVNVIVMDWSGVASRDHAFVVEALPQIADGLRNLIQVLVQTRKISLDKLHLVGHGLGAHLAAFTARFFTNPKIARITGLDPAGNLGNRNSDRLRASDALYVEAIHTDSGESGISEPLGHVDFFPSGGITQTGCTSSQCHHDRAWEMFAASLTHPGSLEGSKCPAESAPIEANCKGYVLQMGNNQYVKYGEGIYFVDANDKYPYYNDLNCVTACMD